jgi:hypothetical protein
MAIKKRDRHINAAMRYLDMAHRQLLAAQKADEVLDLTDQMGFSLAQGADRARATSRDVHAWRENTRQRRRDFDRQVREGLERGVL